MFLSYQQLVYIHLITVVPAFFIGFFLLVRRKGSPSHKLLGKIYLILMLGTGIFTLFMPAQLGPQFLGHFGFIHLFCVLTLYSVSAAYFAIRRGNIRAHRRNMIGLYVGGILIAGAFAFAPGRMLHGIFFG